MEARNISSILSKQRVIPQSIDDILLADSAPAYEICKPHEQYNHQSKNRNRSDRHILKIAGGGNGRRIKPPYNEQNINQNTDHNWFE